MRGSCGRDKLKFGVSLKVAEPPSDDNFSFQGERHQPGQIGARMSAFDADLDFAVVQRGVEAVASVQSIESFAAS